MATVAPNFSGALDPYVSAALAAQAAKDAAAKATPTATPTLTPTATPAKTTTGVQPVANYTQAATPVPQQTLMDPLAFGTGNPTSQSFVSGTAGLGTNGVLGYNYVPGSVSNATGQGNALVDLGSGMFAPTPGTDVSQGISWGTPQVYLPPDYSPFGQTIGSVTSVGKITGWNANGQPIYDTSVTNPNNPDPWTAHDQVTDPSIPVYQAPSGPPGELPTGQQALEMALRGTSADPNSPLHDQQASMGTTPVFVPGLSDGGTTPGATTGTGGGGSTGGINDGNTSGTGGGSATGSGLGPVLTPVDPSNDLRNFQITPGALLDRFKLAQEQYGTFADATSAQYQAALRDATRAAAGAGRLGSGMLRTSYGDLANQRAQSLQNERDALFQGALLGSVQDAQTQFQDYMAEQGYQTQAQNQAFNQAVTAQQLQEQLTNGQFQRALATLIQGQANDPASTQLALSQIFGNQASGANQGLGLMMQGLAGGSGGSSQYDQLLQQLLGQYNQTSTTQPIAMDVLS